MGSCLPCKGPIKKLPYVKQDPTYKKLKLPQSASLFCSCFKIKISLKQSVTKKTEEKTSQFPTQPSGLFVTPVAHFYEILEERRPKTSLSREFTPQT